MSLWDGRKWECASPSSVSSSTSSTAAWTSLASDLFGTLSVARSKSVLGVCVVLVTGAKEKRTGHSEQAQGKSRD